MFHIEILVEELSAESALRKLVPRILGDACSFRIHTFQGKHDLLRKLPDRLRGYAHWISDANTRVAVLVDEDRTDCLALKGRLEQTAAEAGLLTKSSAQGAGTFLVLNRIAIEELEAWFFGDCDAIRAAYPGVPNNLETRSAFRQPDSIAGGTWERLEQVLQRAGYHRGGLAKVVAARDIAEHMVPARNVSPSFRQFKEGIEAMARSA